MNVKSIAGKILTIIGLLTALALVVAASILIYNYVLKDMFAYNKAKSLMQKGSFSEAQDIFEELGGYNDSRTMVKQCEYEIALEFLEEGRLDSGYRKLEKLGKFNDAETYKKQHIYGRATALLEESKFAEAKELFSEISDYSDSTDMIKECRYREAMVYFEAKDFTKSNPIFRELDGYKDSAKLVHEKHTYTLIEAREATCTSAGYKKYACICGYTDQYETGAIAHTYSQATCTEPQTCKYCGVKKGSPLGHRTGYVHCTRCGKQLVEKLNYKGTGNKSTVITSLPSGAYNITFVVTAPAGKNIAASATFYYENSICTSVSCTIDARKSSTAISDTVVKKTVNLGGIKKLNINMGSNFDASWELTIEPC